MSIAKLILAAFDHGKPMSNQQLCERTGVHLKIVSSWVAQFRGKGYIVRVSPERETPVVHMRVFAIAPVHGNAEQDTDRMVREAVKSQPRCVWDLAER